MAPRNNRGRVFSKKRIRIEESTFTSGITALEDFHFDCGIHKRDEQFKE